MLTDLTEDEQRYLEKLRLARLREVIEPLSRVDESTNAPAIVLLDLDYTLNIYCTSPALVDELLQHDLSRAAKVILGCYAVNVWLGDEIVWSHPETELSFSTTVVD